MSKAGHEGLCINFTGFAGGGSGKEPSCQHERCKRRGFNPWVRKAFDCVDDNKLWKILKEMGIPDHLTCLLRNLYAGQEATFRTGYGRPDWFQIRKEYTKVACCYPAYLTYMQNTI